MSFPTYLRVLNRTIDDFSEIRIDRLLLKFKDFNWENS